MGYVREGVGVRGGGGGGGGGEFTYILVRYI